MASWIYQKDYLLDIAHKFDKSIKLYTKDNWWQKLHAWLLWIVTFGCVSRDRYLQQFATTEGHMHFYPKEWSTATVERVLPHEARHTRQFRWFGFGIHPAVGIPLGTICALLFPIPMLLAWGRFWMELDADRASYRYKLETGIIGPDTVRWYADNKALSVSGPSYAWAWPRSWAIKSYSKMAEEVISEWEKSEAELG